MEETSRGDGKWRESLQGITSIQSPFKAYFEKCGEMEGCSRGRVYKDAILVLVNFKAYLEKCGEKGELSVRLD